MRKYTLSWSDCEARVEVEGDDVSVIFEPYEGESVSLDKQNFEEFYAFYQAHLGA